MSASALGLYRGEHAQHPLHAESRVWQETNCYVDLWIELVHALGRDPHAMLGCALATSYELDQWLFFKPAHGDLFELYGIDVQELTIWRDALAHASTHVAAGRLVLLEVDAYFLPDTKGVSYQHKHAKTTIAVEHIDLAERGLGYFHNAGYFKLQGADFDGLFGVNGAAPPLLPPYAELVKPGTPDAARDAELAERALRLLPTHLARIPRDNPFEAYRAPFVSDLRWLMEHPPETYHEYAFATLRQLGAAFELSAAFLAWLARAGLEGAPDARTHYELLATYAKTLQFKAARSVMLKREADFTSAFDALAETWAAAIAAVRRAYG